MLRAPLYLLSPGPGILLLCLPARQLLPLRQQVPADGQAQLSRHSQPADRGVPGLRGPALHPVRGGAGDLHQGGRGQASRHRPGGAPHVGGLTACL